MHDPTLFSSNVPADDEPGEDHLDDPGDDCKQCDAWGEEEFDTSHWDEKRGDLTVTHHTRTVGTEWSIGPGGEDSNEDGWCD